MNARDENMHVDIRVTEPTDPETQVQYCCRQSPSCNIPGWNWPAQQFAHRCRKWKLVESSVDTSFNLLAHTAALPSYWGHKSVAQTYRNSNSKRNMLANLCDHWSIVQKSSVFLLFPPMFSCPSLLLFSRHFSPSSLHLHFNFRSHRSVNSKSGQKELCSPAPHIHWKKPILLINKQRCHVNLTPSLQFSSLRFHSSIVNFLSLLSCFFFFNLQLAFIIL